jgi:O-antigen ligase
MPESREANAPLVQPAVTFGLPVLLPVLIFVAYTNISDVLLRTFGIPSLLQATILLLAVIVWLARDMLRPLGVIVQPVTLLLIAYCALLFISSAWADDLSWADFRISEAVKGLVILVIAAALMSSWARLRIGLATLVVTAAFLAAISLLQLALHDTTHDLGGLAQIQTGNLYGDVSEPRAAGPLSDPNFYGQILLIAIPIGAFLAASIKKETSQRRTRIFFAAAATVVFGGVLVTYSRGAMLSVGAMLLVVPLVIPVRARVVVPVAVAAALLMAVLPSTVVQRFGTVTNVFRERGDEREEARDASVDKRKLLFEAGVRMFDDAPLFGVGAGNFGKHYSRYAYEVGSSAAQYDDPGDRQYPHSLYVELLAENGLAGFACFAAAMAAAFVSLVRSRRALLARGAEDAALLAASIAIALAGYLVSSLFLHSAYQRYLWLLLAFVPAIARLSRDSPEVTA